jgi:hypothetical protein
MLLPVIMADIPVGLPSPAAAVAPAAASPIAQRLAPVVINGVQFEAVEFDTDRAVWRNLAVTVTNDHLAAWQALSAGARAAYAQQMATLYRAGMKYDRDIKLSFVDEGHAVLDQYVWAIVPKR